MTWRTGNPPKGEYIVITRGYELMAMGYYRPDMGWCINGRWLGHNAVICWHEPPAMPKNLEAMR
jgi:hypothetical protein